MKTLKISDSNNEFLLFDLRDILELINDGNKFTWTIREIDINIIEPSKQLLRMNDKDYSLLDSIMDSKGYDIIWDELIRISTLNIQVINGCICGYYDDKRIVIKVVDGSYWTVVTNVDLIIHKIKNRFPCSA